MILSVNEINKLGRRLSSSNYPLEDDLKMIQEYRESFSKPLSEVFKIVSDVAENFKTKCVVSYRIKRIDTIISKLKRLYKKKGEPSDLKNMTDIGGCRCVISTKNDEEIYAFCRKLKDRIKAPFVIAKEKDYVANPKEDGYRSYHIHVKDEASNRKVEIQIRNKPMHSWATLVEITDFVFSKKLKEGEKDPKREQFFRLWSKRASLSLDEKNEMVRLEHERGIFKNVQKMIESKRRIVSDQWDLHYKSDHNYLVLLVNHNHLHIRFFTQESDAENFYFRYFKRVYGKDNEPNIVLVRLDNPTLSKLCLAYPNYTLQSQEYFDSYCGIVYPMLDALNGKDERKDLSFVLKAFLDNIYAYFSLIFREYENMENDRILVGNSTLRRARKQAVVKSYKNCESRWKQFCQGAFENQISSLNFISRFMLRRKFKRIRNLDGQCRTLLESRGLL